MALSVLWQPSAASYAASSGSNSTPASYLSGNRPPRVSSVERLIPGKGDHSKLKVQVSNCKHDVAAAELSLKIVMLSSVSLGAGLKARPTAPNAAPPTPSSPQQDARHCVTPDPSAAVEALEASLEACLKSAAALGGAAPTGAAARLAAKAERLSKTVAALGDATRKAAPETSDDEADHESVAAMVERGYEVDYLALRRAMEQGDSLDVGWSGTRNALEMIAGVVAAGGGGFSAPAGSDGEGGIALPEVDVEGFVKSFPLFSMFGKNDDEA